MVLKNLFYCNIRSVRKNIDTLLAYVLADCHDFGLICLSETWMNLEETVHIEGYSSVGLGRNTGRGGGVVIYVENGSTYYKLDRLCKVWDILEIVTIKLDGGILSCVYRPPGGNLPAFLSLFESLLDIIITGGCGGRVYIVGDFNIDISLNDDKYVNEFINLIYSYGFDFITDGAPTRPNSGRGTVIDYCLTNWGGTTTTGDKLITDHFPIIFQIDLDVAEVDITTRKIDNVKITHATLDTFRNIMLDTDWSFLKDITCVNLYYNVFLEYFLGIYQTVFTTANPRYFETDKTLKRKTKKSAPWFNSEIKKAINKRDGIARKLKRCAAGSHAALLNLYKKQRNTVVALIRKIKKQYLERKIGDCLNQGGKWRELNKIIGKDKPTNKVDALEVNQNMITDDSIKANIFKDHFIEEPIRIVTDIERAEFSGTVGVNVVPSTIYLSPITYPELERVVKGLPLGKAPGMDGISAAVVKAAFTGVAHPLLELYNLSLESGVFPTRLKVARVLPIFKKGSRTLLTNYRPISLISIFSKILEKLIYNKMISFLGIHKVLVDEQYGFRDHRSTELALLDFWDGVESSKKLGKTTLAVFLDLTRAFDCINHELLLRKMMIYGLRGKINDLIRSYLLDRNMIVTVNGVDSKIGIINRGVPQGSSLGPLLFLLYINDLVAHITGFKVTMYADDTTCVFSDVTLTNVVRRANTDLLGLITWMKSNELRINYSKSKFIIFGARKYDSEPVSHNSQIILDGQALERVHSFKLLGVWLDSNGTWKTHNESVAREIAISIGRIRAVSQLIDSHRVLVQLYYALVYSRLAYGITLWGCAGVSRQSALLKLQKRCVRIILSLGYRDHVQYMFPTLRLLTIGGVYRFRIAMTMYGILKGTTKVNSLSNLFLWARDLHNHDTRRRGDLYIHTSKTLRGWRIFRYQGPLVWNSIPLSIRDVSGWKIFRKKLFEYTLLET